MDMTQDIIIPFRGVVPTARFTDADNITMQNFPGFHGIAIE